MKQCAAYGEVSPTVPTQEQHSAVNKESPGNNGYEKMDEQS